MLKDFLLIGVGGFLGSITRYGVYLLTTAGATYPHFPLATFTVNAVGSLLIGLLMAIVGQSGWYFLCVVGFCGGFTTFSTFSVEMVTMVRNGNLGWAAIYVLLSVIVCMSAVWLGIYLGDKIKI